MLKIKSISLLVFMLSIMMSCKSTNPVIQPEFPVNPPTPSYLKLSLNTDKAAYKPGEEVTFTISSTELPTNAKVRYKYGNEVVSEISLTSSTWKWQVPSVDFRGYIVEVFETKNDTETIYATTAVDVSSEWTKFPRYGFLSKFDLMSDAAQGEIIENLNKYHINGLQFYDWHNKHHKPLPVTNGVPASTWKDIGNRSSYFSTIQKYIDLAHNRNMKTMFYDLVYGAWDNAEADGVKNEWYIYKDSTQTNKEIIFLQSPPFLSNIYLLDPSNIEWQNYMKEEVKNVYKYLNFDGYHMDQLGDLGAHYTSKGKFLNLALTYQSYIDAIKNAAPEKFNVMNAVAQYGQQGIASSQSDFLYSEVWNPSESYNDLSNIIKQNNILSNNTKNTILAAYMNYDMADNKGYFNTPSVLMTNAVIFAFGGAHLELGEHMLCKEYFPNDNLMMKEDLKKSLEDYYDFLVAYQNLLRDGGTFNNIMLESSDNKMTMSSWPASQGSVAVFGKNINNNTQVVHLINFTNSTTQKWRDNSGSQVQPAVIKDAKVILTTSKKVKKIWIASPDFVGGASRVLNFKQSSDKLYFILPELMYWDMIVLEF
ncbi:conserved exported hypothetical protein [uncultured Paludibacter sp.]|uniref:Cycloisomaltooligosaccharide glucanotransferase n=1 Tax=uncultured Paludibacter sp. TaxID=497635 RepID=A0A653AKT7_9BACT|nr:conserved exported hypothetical protein [uncultured Paludibacter sp.]